MHDMNQTEAEYLRHSKRSQTASLSQIGPVVLNTRIQDIYLRMYLQNRSRDLRIDHDSDFGPSALTLSFRLRTRDRMHCMISNGDNAVYIFCAIVLSSELRVGCG